MSIELQARASYTDQTSLQTSEVDFVAETIERIVNTASAENAKSRNLEFLREHFDRHQTLNLHAFICGSTLFRWAELDIWRHHACCAHSQNPRIPTPSPNDHSVRTEEEIQDLEQLYSGLRNTPTVHAPNTSNSQPIMAAASPSEALKRGLSAKLHCLYGVPVQHVHRGGGVTSASRYSLRSETAPIHPYVRSLVYDLRQHQDGTFWGPFLDDGSLDVDWEKIEAIMILLDYNLSCFARAHEVVNEHAIPDWSRPFNGATPYSFVSKSVNVPLKPSTPLEARDPYNVTGTWMRIVCFLDYTELYDFNFGSGYPAATEPRPPLDTEEAIRLITMRIEVTSIEAPGEEDGQALPVVHFKGASSAVRPSWDPNANSRIKGRR